MANADRLHVCFSCFSVCLHCSVNIPQLLHSTFHYRLGWNTSSKICYFSSNGFGFRMSASSTLASLTWRTDWSSVTAQTVACRTMFSSSRIPTPTSSGRQPLMDPPPWSLQSLDGGKCWEDLSDGLVETFRESVQSLLIPLAVSPIAFYGYVVSWLSKMGVSAWENVGEFLLGFCHRKCFYCIKTCF